MTTYCIISRNLPTIWECVITIWQISSTVGSAKQNLAMLSLSSAILNQWKVIYPDQYLILQCSIKSKLKNYVQKFRKITLLQKDKDKKMTEFRQRYSILMDVLKPEIRTNLKSLPFELAKFYKDQCAERLMTFDDIDSTFLAIDNESSVKMNSNNLESFQQSESDMDIDENIDIDATMHTDEDLDCSMKLRSGKRLNLVDAETQTEYVALTHFPTVPIKHGKRHTERVKFVIANVSASVGITVDQALTAFHYISNEYFDQEYSLSKSLASNFLENEEIIKELQLPSAQTIRRSKHKLAIGAEKVCAVALLEKSENEKAVLYYDSTTRKAIKGEWTTINIMIGKHFYRLRPLSLSRETREQIAELFVVVLNRLALLAGCTVCEIWSQIDALMTDSVAKNMEVEKLVAAAIKSSHIPIHLICQSHLCESFDRAVSKTLLHIEETISLKERMIEKMPELASFLTNTTVTLACLNAISSLVNDTGKNSNIHTQWIKILKDSNKTNKFYSFRENRFAQTGYFAAAVIHHWDDLKSLVTHQKTTNKLVQAVKEYLQLDFLKSAIKAIATFSANVTFPYLNLAEIGTQKDFVEILPILYVDLQNGKIDTLHQYKIPYSFPLEYVLTDIEKAMLAKFTHQAAENLKIARGREYGFDESQCRKERGTRVDLLCDEDLSKLPTNNVSSERELAAFDLQIKKFARATNQYFKGHEIRDNICLRKSNLMFEIITSTKKELMQILDEQEREWAMKQEKHLESLLQKNFENAQLFQDKANDWIKEAKENWNGPLTTAKELTACFRRQRSSKEEKHILKTEIRIKKFLSPRDSIVRKNLYMLNTLTPHQLKLNLLAILKTPYQQTCNFSEFPSNEKIIECIEKL